MGYFLQFGLFLPVAFTYHLLLVKFSVTGFIGKGMTRHMNRIWNYLIKGFFGTLAWTVLFPIVCVVISTISIIFALCAIIW